MCYAKNRQPTILVPVLAKKTADAKACFRKALLGLSRGGSDGEADGEQRYDERKRAAYRETSS